MRPLTLCPPARTSSLRAFLAACLSIVVASSAAAFGQQTGGDQTPSFRVSTNLVLVPFRAIKDGSAVSALKPQDILLLEDGRPQKITVFEGGASSRRSIPIEITLLFDTDWTAPGQHTWELNEMYNFVKSLSPETIQATLLASIPNVRYSIYCFYMDRSVSAPLTLLRRVCGPTRDARELLTGFARLPDPERGSVKIDLSSVPPHRYHKISDRGEFGWAPHTYEALVATLQDSGGGPGGAIRLLVAFAKGTSITYWQPEEAAANAVEHGIRIYPVLLGYQRWHQVFKKHELALKAVWATGTKTSPTGGRESLSKGDPELPPHSRRLLESMQVPLKDMEAFGTLGPLTGGKTFIYNNINLGLLREILDDIWSEVSSEYIAGFVPSASGSPPRKHKISVKLVSEKTGKLRGGTRTIVY